MQHHATAFPVHAFQLKSFKSKAKALSIELSKLVPDLSLSAFQRNDYLSMALGYKGHSDLVVSTSFRASSCKDKELDIFSNCIVRENIINIFSENIPHITKEQVSLCCLLLSENLEIIKSRGIEQMLANSTLEDIHFVINGVLTDVSTGWMWDGRASVWLRSVLSVLVCRRDKQGIKFSVDDVRSMLSINNTKAVSDELKENGFQDKAMLNYYIEIGRSINAEERHSYYQNLIEKTLSIIEKSCEL